MMPMELTRRHFVKGLSVAGVAAALPDISQDNRLPIAFSTLACPAWEWMKILDYAAAHDFSAIELRGLQGNFDLPTHAAFSATQIAQSKRDIAAHNLRIACISSSAHMDESSAAKRAKELSDAKRFLDLAASLGAPYIRVFGTNPDNDMSTIPTADVKKRVAASMHELGDYAAPRNVTVLMESHDNFVTSGALGDVLHEAASDHVALLWDAHHTWADGKEEPEFTVSKLGKWIRHTHLKDSAPATPERRYVLTGRGDSPIKRQIAVLQKLGYQGYYCFEWEKAWRPDLDEPEIAIADYSRVMSGYLCGAK
jgi:sugar phosphate isomerase/epimerase